MRAFWKHLYGMAKRGKKLKKPEADKETRFAVLIESHVHRVGRVRELLAG